jgi:hypothetical protein
VEDDKIACSAAEVMGFLYALLQTSTIVELHISKTGDLMFNNAFHSQFASKLSFCHQGALKEVRKLCNFSFFFLLATAKQEAYERTVLSFHIACYLVCKTTPDSIKGLRQ